MACWLRPRCSLREGVHPALRTSISHSSHGYHLSPSTIAALSLARSRSISYDQSPTMGPGRYGRLPFSWLHRLWEQRQEMIQRFSGLFSPTLFPFFLSDEPLATGSLSFPLLPSRYSGLPRTVMNIVSWDSGRQGRKGSGAGLKGIPRPRTQRPSLSFLLTVTGGEPPRAMAVQSPEYSRPGQTLSP